MLLSVIVMAAALAGAEPPAAAAGAAPAAVAPVTAPAPKPEKKKLVCVEEPQMGSLFKQKTCATPEEWEKRRERDREAMSRSGGRGACTGENC